MAHPIPVSAARRKVPWGLHLNLYGGVIVPGTPSRSRDTTTARPVSPAGCGGVISPETKRRTRQICKNRKLDLNFFT